MGSRTLLVSLALLVAALTVILFRFTGSSDETAPGLSPGEEWPAESPNPAPLRVPGAGRIAPESPVPSGSEVSPPALAEPEVGTESVAPAPGCLRVIVRQRGAPVADRPVLLLRSGDYWLPRELSTVEAELTRLMLDGQGEATACSLEPGSYIVGVELGPGQVPQHRLTLVEEEGQTVTIELAGASLFGTVYDEDGGPAEGARVQVSLSTGVVTVVWTDTLGGYRVEAIAAGVRWVGVADDGSPYGDGDHMLQVHFSEGEAKRLDFGDPAGLVTWSGVLRNRAGDPVGSPQEGRKPAHVHLTRVADRDYRSAPVGEDGRFSLRLTRGEYRVAVNPPGCSDRLDPGETVVVASVDFELDLVLPGTRVHGRVLDSLTGQPGRGPFPHTVRAHLEGQQYSAAFHHATIAADGSYAFDGLEAGVWRVGSSHAPLDAYVEVRVREGDLELSIDLEHVR